MDVMGFEDLQSWVQRGIKNLSPTAQKRMMRDMALMLRKRQQQRVRQQVNPDGTPWAKRVVNKKKPRTKGQKRATRSKRYILNYVDSKGHFTTRAILIRQITDQQIAAIDLDDDDKFKTFSKTRITSLYDENTPVDVGAMARTQKPRTGKMMKELSKSAHMRIKHHKAGAEIGYYGAVARVARIHHEGEVDDLGRGNDYRFPVRALLGLSPDDIDAIERLALHHLGLGLE